MRTWTLHLGVSTLDCSQDGINLNFCNKLDRRLGNHWAIIRQSLCSFWATNRAMIGQSLGNQLSNQLSNDWAIIGQSKGNHWAIIGQSIGRSIGQSIGQSIEQ
jgi:hypothetical protein